MKRFAKLHSLSRRFLVLLIFLINLVPSNQSLAATPPSLKNAAGFLSQTASGSGAYYTPESPSVLIGNLINYFLGFIGVIFLILTIYAGITWMTAGGNEEKIKKAKQLITNSVIGLIIVLAAYSLTFFIVSRILVGTAPPPP